LIKGVAEDVESMSTLCLLICLFVCSFEITNACFRKLLIDLIALPLHVLTEVWWWNYATCFWA